MALSLLRFKRGTRAELAAAAGSSGLNLGEPYMITDEGRLAIGVSDSEYADLALAKKPTVQEFATSDTWTRPTGCRFVRVLVVGGGGGGGGCGATNGTTQSAGGSSAGGGGWSIKWIDVSAIASVTVTVGAAGAGGPAGVNNGTSGGTSSFGAHCSATGGGYGVGLGASIGNGYPGGHGGVGSGGDENGRGMHGAHAYQIGNTPVIDSGGDSYFGGGAPPPSVFSAQGNAGLSPGAGGSGARSKNTTAYAGGDGAAGVVIVEEFY